MARDRYEELFQFRGNKVHSDIVKEYHKKFPQFSKEADVLRHAIVLLDENMRKQDGQDDLSVLIKKVALLEKAENKSRMQMDVLILLILELVSRSGSNLTWDDAEQEIRDRIGSAVTKKSEVRNVKTKKQEQVENHFEDKLTIKANKEEEVFNSIPTESKGSIPLISDEDKITLRNGIPHKSVWIDGREYFDEISWDQIPEHRMSELA
ncbi:hypothetical protein FT637_24930 [Bacillus cereus]|uniref:hypothetical protein n=1 Tax=Bacillus cereus TaxID=1396 RepID=UPI00187996AB|nr:hypothetical protein [Bacillus cereus]MBE7106133.1 hypothetical protein [Bacillus cereus]